MRTKTLLILLLIYSITIATNAQQAATVKNFTLTTDFIPGSDRRNDLNNTPCALVKVQVVDEIVRIEGNKIGNIINKGVEKWVYMCKGSTNMRIHLKNHLPVKVMFKDYQIKGLESNRVYELVIEIPHKEENTSLDISHNDNNYNNNISHNVSKQKFILNYTPNNATVLVDSKPYQSNGRIELELTTGEHSYIIAAVGYITAEGTVKLNEQAPRVITENLISEVQTKPTNESKNKKKSDKKKNREEKNNLLLTEEIQATEASNQNTPSSTSSTIKIVKPLNISSLKYNYKNVTFKCKVKNSNVIITEFYTGAEEVTIPAHIIIDNVPYPVTEIKTYINGNNYSAKKLTIEEGVQIIDNFSFMEFIKLQEVTIPNSIIEIGKKAFRSNPTMKFNLPVGINESDLREGREIKIIK